MTKKELPAYVRRCVEAARTAERRNRELEVECLKFYANDQWRDGEKRARMEDNRPIITINKCKPAVDQIEGDIRLNTPGPQVHPIGGGADKDVADIWEGILREVEYRSHANVAYAKAGVYSAAGGRAYLELDTEYESDTSFAQRVVINAVEDPSTIYFDPAASMANRQDAEWAAKLQTFSKDEYVSRFGPNRGVLKGKRSWAAAGWIRDALGIDTDLARINEWTGGGEGPFYVAEFCMVEREMRKLRMYTDYVARFDDEDVPEGVTPREGKEYAREVPVRTIKLYTVDAFEVLEETVWLGKLLKWIPVLGPEVYIDGRLRRMSLISGAMDANRGLNYVASSASEIAGNLTRAPWIGPQGTFDDPRWEDANRRNYAYLEYKPVHTVDETTGQVQLAPPPQRNTYEVSIQWLVQLGAWFSDSIKAVTAIYDPSLGQQKGDQSGKAIEQLRSESNVGNFSYADNLHRAIEILYNEVLYISQQILDGSRVQAIIRADSQHELVEINREFPQGQEFTKDGKPKPRNDITKGQYAVRVIVGQNFDTRDDQAAEIIINFAKANPAVMQNPQVAAATLRFLGAGNPAVENIADLISPSAGAEPTPQQAQRQLQAAQLQNQQLEAKLLELDRVLQAKLPQVQADKEKAALDSLTKIRVAEINASKDLDKANADRMADMLEHVTGMAHDSAMQAVEHSHQAGLQQSQQDAAAQAQAAETKGAE